MKKTIWKKRIVALGTALMLVLVIVAFVKISVSAEVNETSVYVTKSDIPPRTEITKDMLEKITVPSQGIPSDAIKSEKDIVGKWTVAGYGIPSHSFLYKDKIVSKSDMPDSGILELEKNEVAFPLLVDLETSLGNSIIPDSRVDLYFKSSIKDDDSNSKAIYGKLASQVRVVAVKDADASNVFDPEGYKQGEEQTSVTKKNQKSLAKIYIFALPKDLNDLVNKAKLIGDIVPIATGHSYDADTKTESGQNDVIDYIKDSSYTKDQKNK